MSNQNPSAGDEQEARLESPVPSETTDADDMHSADDDEDDDVDDFEARGLDDDSGYGPDSNWSHTMNKDD